MAKSRPAVAGLGQQPGAGEPIRPGRQAAYGQDLVDIELLARHRGRFEQRPLLAGQAGRPQQHRLPDAVGHHGGTAAVAQGQGQFLHGERDPVSPAGHRRGQGRLGLPAEQVGQHQDHVLIAQRTDVDLGELAAPAQLGADGTQAVVARKLVAAVTADQRDRKGRPRRRPAPAAGRAWPGRPTASRRGTARAIRRRPGWPAPSTPPPPGRPGPDRLAAQLVREKSGREPAVPARSYP